MKAQFRQDVVCFLPLETAPGADGSPQYLELPACFLSFSRDVATLACWFGSQCLKGQIATPAPPVPDNSLQEVTMRELTVSLDIMNNLLCMYLGVVDS